MFALPILAGAALSKVLAPKAPKAAPVVAAAPQVQVRQNSAVSDALAARSGSRVNQRTGARGVEAGAGLKSKLGQ